MSEIKTKIRTYNDVIDLFGEEKAADMLSEALGWSTTASISSPDSSVTATSTGRADISTRRKKWKKSYPAMVGHDSLRRLQLFQWIL